MNSFQCEKFVAAFIGLHIVSDCNKSYPISDMLIKKNVIVLKFYVKYGRNAIKAFINIVRNNFKNYLRCTLCEISWYVD